MSLETTLTDICRTRQRGLVRLGFARLRQGRFQNKQAVSPKASTCSVVGRDRRARRVSRTSVFIFLPSSLILSPVTSAATAAPKRASTSRKSARWTCC
jgi:hypothetical protein